MLETSWEAMEETGQPVIQAEFSAELQAVEEEFSEETQQILACLKPKDRELFLRLYIEEENMEEVSQSTGLAKPVIYNRLSRGKKRIRSLFSANREKEPSLMNEQIYTLLNESIINRIPMKFLRYLIWK